MKKLQLLSSIIVFTLVGCNDNSYKPANPAVGSLNNVVESSAIGSCPGDKASGGEEDFVHVDQHDLLTKIAAGKHGEVFKEAFEKGDIIFGTFFTQEQGGGANVGGILIPQYTRMPRADLTASGQWATHTPTRATGPNAQSCKECHNLPDEDGAGTVALNVHRDPNHSNDPKSMIQRNTPHLFGQGALQLLAEEMTNELKAIVNNASKEACATGQEVKSDLIAKAINFGYITMTCNNGQASVDNSHSKINGVDPDLVVRPFEWKKSVAFVRDFMRGASHNEIGMQGTEIVGKGIDGDGDGITDELTVGDLTVFSVYMAAQPRPTTKLELEKLGIIDKMNPSEHQQIARGEKLFGKGGVDCASCHQPKLKLKSAIFSEPSQSPYHRDKTEVGANTLPVNLADEGVIPEKAITFDLTKDQPDNVLCKDGKTIHLGSLETEQGQAVVKLYSDLKKHYMGDDLAEPIDELGTGHMAMVPYEPVNSIVTYEHSEEEAKSTFGTKELWGVACTGPWLHDGRATTLRQAILLHGGEADSSRDAFAKLDENSKKDLIAFLGNQVLYMKKAGSVGIPKLSSVCEVKELQ